MQKKKKKKRCQPTSFYRSLGLVNGALIGLQLCVCVLMWVCVWFDSAFVAPHSRSPPHTRWAQREKVLTTVKEEVALVKNAESLHSQRSLWCMEDAKVAVAAGG